MSRKPPTVAARLTQEALVATDAAVIEAARKYGAPAVQGALITHALNAGLVGGPGLRADTIDMLETALTLLKNQQAALAAGARGVVGSA